MQRSHPVHFCASHRLLTARAHQTTCFHYFTIKIPCSASLLSSSQLTAEHPVCSAALLAGLPSPVGKVTLRLMVRSLEGAVGRK